MSKKVGLLTIVFDKGSKNSFISRIPVPAGTVITDETYWIPESERGWKVKEDIFVQNHSKKSFLPMYNSYFNCYNNSIC